MSERAANTKASQDYTLDDMALSFLYTAGILE